jgi:hypothetical protein
MAAVVRRKQEKIVDSKCKEIRSHVDKRMGSSKFDGNGAQGCARCNVVASCFSNTFSDLLRLPYIA